VHKLFVWWESGDTCGRELGVRYVREGAVRKAGGCVSLDS
jgi:TolB-like protein